MNSDRRELWKTSYHFPEYLLFVYQTAPMCVGVWGGSGDGIQDLTHAKQTEYCQTIVSNFSMLEQK